LVAVATGHNIEIVERKLQNAADELVKWADKEEMDINIDIAKTKVMLFGTRSRDVIIKIKGLTLANVRSYRYLGVILDENLSFGVQVDNAVCKAKRASEHALK